MNYSQLSQGDFPPIKLKCWTNKEYKYASHVNSMKDYIIQELRKTFEVKGGRNSGYFDVSDLDGNSYTHSINCKKLNLVSKSNTIITGVRGNSSPTDL